MRLRNLFMILLLCMTVGMFGVSCTGDDGAQGPPGPKGDTGEAGEDGSDGSGAMGTYDFLTTWGSDTGTIGCSDPILKGNAAFPGPESLDTIMIGGVPTPGVGITSGCADAVFSALTADNVRQLSKVQGLPDTAAGDLVFIKTEQLIGARAMKESNEIAATSTVGAKRVDSVKEFVGGSFFAELSRSGGNDEFFERAQLYTDCSIGTPPASLKGHWRAIRIEEKENEYSGPGVKLADTETVTTTVKVCLRLDSTPGTVKCFIEKTVNPPGDTTPADTVTEMIALYDATAGEGEELTVVAPLAGDDGMLGTASPPANLDDFFGAGNALTGDNVVKLCNLFEEARTVTQ